MRASLRGRFLSSLLSLICLCGIFADNEVRIFATAASSPATVKLFSSQRGPVGLTWTLRGESVFIQAYGRDSIRVRMSRSSSIMKSILTNGANIPGAVLTNPESTPTDVRVKLRSDGFGGNITNGLARVVVQPVSECCSGGGAAGISALSLRFERSDTGELLLEEEYPLHGLPARVMKPLSRGSMLSSASIKFKGIDGEKFFGLGHHLNGRLEVSGLTIDMDQFNTEISIPFLLSSRNYGFLYNCPSRGRVEVASGEGSKTRWHSTATKVVDYVVFAGGSGSYHDVMERYAEAVGHPAAFPEYASGYWQSKDRYANQAEILNITNEFATRNIPLSVLVIDDDPAFSENVGDWKLNANDWKDPKQMYEIVAAKTGAKVMVSAWPSVTPESNNWDAMYSNGLLACPETGSCAIAAQVASDATIYDSFNADARNYFFQQLKTNHLDLGATLIWLDSCEGSGSVGEDNPFPRTDAFFSEGSVDEVGLMYPFNHQRAIFEGMKAHNETSQPMTLSRSAFAGSSKWGAAVWSGDTVSSWEYLSKQLPASLSLSLSGISAVTFDIGGFSNGINDIDNPEFQELVIRWFQLGTFMPLMRMHGSRSCSKGKRGYVTCPNEPWSFGKQAEKILIDMIRTREKMRPYVSITMNQAQKTGRPPIRPLFFDFPMDASAASIQDEFLFGDDLLIAPIVVYKERSRKVYLPKGTSWTSFWDENKVPASVIEGGTWINASAPLEFIPVFKRILASSSKAV